MKGRRFGWDPAKNEADKRRQRVSLEGAVTVFADERGLLLGDAGHSISGDRSVLLGLRGHRRAVVVCRYCRETEDVIRIICARRATGPERELYDQRRPR